MLWYGQILYPRENCFENERNVFPFSGKCCTADKIAESDTWYEGQHQWWKWVGGGLVAKSYPTLGPHGLCSRLLCPWISQARTLEWVASSFFGGSSQPRNRTRVSCTTGRFFINWVMGEAPYENDGNYKNLKVRIAFRIKQWKQPVMDKIAQ